MRPGNPESDVVVVLDTRPECKVVNDARYMGEWPKLDYDPFVLENTSRFRDSIYARFRSQALALASGELAERPYIEYEVVKDNPAFEVRTGDVPIVMSAARHILDQRNPIDWLFGAVTGRRKAAKHILAVLSDIPTTENGHNTETVEEATARRVREMHLRRAQDEREHDRTTSAARRTMVRRYED